MLVPQHLDLDVLRRLDRLLDVEAAVAERGLRFGRRGVVGVLELVGPDDEKRMPLPPPPALALSRIG